MQNIFLESFALRVLSIYEISRASESKIPGLDGQYFPTINTECDVYLKQQLRNTNYT